LAFVIAPWAFEYSWRIALGLRAIGTAG
jgi:hypothetical protein